MVVELIGGPLDGAVLDVEFGSPDCMMVKNHQEFPIYRLDHCVRCGGRRAVVSYVFLGYEQSLVFEFPKQFENLRFVEANIA